MGIRWIVCLDLESDDPVEAYKELERIMHNETRPDLVSWESSDEAYSDDGITLDPEVLQDARMLAREEVQTKDLYDFPSTSSDYGLTCTECGNSIEYGPKGRGDHNFTCVYYRDYCDSRDEVENA